MQRSGGVATLVALGTSDETGAPRIGVAHMKGGQRFADDGDHDLPIGPRCTVGDMFRILAPGASVTFELAGDAFQILDAQEGPAPAGAPEELAGI